MGDGSRRIAMLGRGVADRVLYRVGGVVGLVALDAAGRHRLRVRRRCGVWRYRELMGHALVMPRARQRVFQRRLRRCARRARAADLLELLDYGWRERLVACWLIAVARRTEVRPRIARDLGDPAPGQHLYAYCVALACLGTEQDAKILHDYLATSLALPGEDNRHCQAAAMGALLYLDRVLGGDRAGRLVSDGAWARWPGSGEVSLDRVRDDAAAMVAFARGADPDVRAARRR